MNLESSSYRQLNDAKANFDSIYTNPDPREYFRVLYGLDYVIPDLAQPIFRSLIAARRAALGRPIQVLDIGCSYGVNAALVRYPIDMQRLSKRYLASEMRAVDNASLTRMDRHYFRSWQPTTDARFVGLDASENAAHYALNAGLLDAAVSTNLESSDPTPRDANVLKGLDLIISTGCVGYVTAKSFRRVLSLQKRGAMPWVANFVLRMFPYDSIEAELSEFGLVTEKLGGVTFVQRRFRSEQEARATMDQLESKGIDPEGKEAQGLLHAELFISRPKDAMEAAPLADLISVTSGANRRYGRRFARNEARDINQVF